MMSELFYVKTKAMMFRIANSMSKSAGSAALLKSIGKYGFPKELKHLIQIGDQTSVCTQ